MAAECKPRRVLDVGAGRGKAPVLLREYVKLNLEIDGVEVEPSYRTPRLLAQYDKLYPCDVRRLPDEVLASYDLILMIDVIEHMDKPSALELLGRMPGYVIVCTPRDYFTQTVPGVPSEDHLSHWTAADFGERVDREDVDALERLAGVVVRLAELPGFSRQKSRPDWEI